MKTNFNIYIPMTCFPQAKQREFPELKLVYRLMHNPIALTYM